MDRKGGGGQERKVEQILGEGAREAVSGEAYAQIHEMKNISS